MQLKMLMFIGAVLSITILFLNAPPRKNRIGTEISVSDIKNSEDLIRLIKSQDSVGHLCEFTFIQETTVYDEMEQPKDTSVWYEAIRYPKDFRIDFGNPNNGNTNINRNDSIYVFRKGKLVYSGPEIQEFLILEGGLFHYTVEETLEKLENLGIDTSFFSLSTYGNRPVYIIGASDETDIRPQVWLDMQEHYIVRRWSQGKNGELYEVRYYNFQNFGGHWIETEIEFLKNGKLIQTEKYTNIDTDPNLENSIFQPVGFEKNYWFQK